MSVMAATPVAYTLGLMDRPIVVFGRSGDGAKSGRRCKSLVGTACDRNVPSRVRTRTRPTATVWAALRSSPAKRGQKMRDGVATTSRIAKVAVVVMTYCGVAGIWSCSAWIERGHDALA